MFPRGGRERGRTEVDGTGRDGRDSGMIVKFRMAAMGADASATEVIFWGVGKR